MRRSGNRKADINFAGSIVLAIIGVWSPSGPAAELSPERSLAGFTLSINRSDKASTPLVALYDGASQVPFPNNALFAGSNDFSINIPVANPTNFSDPTVALNALDGWGTTTAWSSAFSVAPTVASLRAFDAVRLFEVSLDAPAGIVTAA